VAVARKVIILNRGSKRRLKQIRWKITEVFSLALLTIFALAILVVYILWEAHRQHPYSEPPKDPQIRDSQPTGPE
jgi:hypothetical protein